MGAAAARALRRQRRARTRARPPRLRIGVTTPHAPRRQAHRAGDRGRGDHGEWLVLPDTAKEKPQKGKVIAVGDGKFDEDGDKRIPLDVAEGDEVLYSKYGGTEIKVDGEELLVLRESDVLAKII